MAIDVGRVIRGALVAWVGMTGMMVAGRRAGLTRMDIAAIEGGLVAPPHTTTAKGAGFAMHLLLSLAIGFAYALGFARAGLRPGWRTGLLGGAVHWLLATPATGLLSRWHPRRGQLAMPGFGGTALGPADAAGFLGGHLLFGALFGWQYGRDGR